MKGNGLIYIIPDVILFDIHIFIFVHRCMSAFICAYICECALGTFVNEWECIRARVCLLLNICVYVCIYVSV